MLGARAALGPRELGYISPDAIAIVLSTNPLASIAQGEVPEVAILAVVGEFALISVEAERPGRHAP